PADYRGWRSLNARRTPAGRGNLCSRILVPPARGSLAKLYTSRRWLRWLKPGLEVKRWIGLFALAILLLDLGAAYALKTLYGNIALPSQSYWITLQFWPHWLRAIIFVTIGVSLLVFSFWRLQRSVLGPFLPGSDQSLAEQLDTFRTRSRGPRVVAIGGGTGLSTLLRGLKEYTANLA